MAFLKKLYTLIRMAHDCDIVATFIFATRHVNNVLYVTISRKNAEKKLLRCIVENEEIPRICDNYQLLFFNTEIHYYIYKFIISCNNENMFSGKYFALFKFVVRYRLCI